MSISTKKMSTNTKEMKNCCKKFNEAVEKCNIFHKVQYGTDGTEYSWGHYTDVGEKLWDCPFCKKELE